MDTCVLVLSWGIGFGGMPLCVYLPGFHSMDLMTFVIRLCNDLLIGSCFSFISQLHPIGEVKPESVNWLLNLAWVMKSVG